jgi:hypothetical protein
LNLESLMTLLHKIFYAVKVLRRYSFWMDFVKDSGNVKFIISCCDSSDLMSGCLLLLLLLLLLFINEYILWNFQQRKGAIKLIL